MSEDKEKRTIKLTVTDCRVLAEWENNKAKGGKATTTLYEVQAVKEDGEPLMVGSERAELRSFMELEIGVLEVYEIEAYDHPEHGRTWTLKRPRRNTLQRVVALEKTVVDLADRLAALEARQSGSTGDIAPADVKPDWGGR